MNIWVGTGRLVRDPETHYTSGRESMCIGTFTMAIDRAVRPGQDKQTDYPRIKVFGKTAENCERFLSKGSKVAVQGSVQTGEYEKDGRKIYYTEIAAFRVEFLDNRQPAPEPQKQTEMPVVQEGFRQVQDDDIPF